MQHGRWHRRCEQVFRFLLVKRIGRPDPLGSDPLGSTLSALKTVTLLRRQHDLKHVRRDLLSALGNEVRVSCHLVNITPWLVDDRRVAEVCMQRLIQRAKKPCTGHPGKREQMRIIGLQRVPVLYVELFRVDRLILNKKGLAMSHW